MGGAAACTQPDPAHLPVRAAGLRCTTAPCKRAGPPTCSNPYANPPGTHAPQHATHACAPTCLARMCPNMPHTHAPQYASHACAPTCLPNMPRAHACLAHMHPNMPRTHAPQVPDVIPRYALLETARDNLLNRFIAGGRTREEVCGVACPCCWHVATGGGRVVQGWWVRGRLVGGG